MTYAACCVKICCAYLEAVEGRRFLADMKNYYNTPFANLEVIKTEDVLLDSIDLPVDEFDVEVPSTAEP